MTTDQDLHEQRGVPRTSTSGQVTLGAVAAELCGWIARRAELPGEPDPVQLDHLEALTLRMWVDAGPALAAAPAAGAPAVTNRWVVLQRSAGVLHSRLVTGGLDRLVAGPGVLAALERVRCRVLHTD